MTPERWDKIKDLLATALEVAPADRATYLDQHCAGDDLLRRDVELLLQREHEADSQFLGETAFAEIAAAVLPEEGNPWVGRRVGAYQIVEQTGAGGMGEVYRAFRADDQYRKEVALIADRLKLFVQVCAAVQVLLASLAFPVWVFAIGGPFQYFHWYEGWIAKYIPAEIVALYLTTSGMVPLGPE